MPKTGEWTIVGQMYLYCLFNGLAVILVGIITTSLTLIEPEDGLTETALCEVFRRFDKDGSGVLEMDEAKNALTEIGERRYDFKAHTHTYTHTQTHIRTYTRPRRNR